jgi:uncharacterized protein (TIGR02186 family)
MTRWFRSGLCLIAPTLLGAANPVLVPGVSQDKVEIAYSFTGATLLLFGAIRYPGEAAPARDADIVVVLRGPSESITVREKEKLAGLVWANANSAQFRSAPGFYAIASSKPFDKLIDERTAAIYELGLGNLHLSPASGTSAEEQRRFETGLVDLRRRQELFKDGGEKVTITDGVLYSARLSIPARVPVGLFTAETFLIRNGKVLAAATREIDVRKTGFERFVADSAVRWPITYGIIAVAFSLLMGWGAGRVFRRD